MVSMRDEVDTYDRPNMKRPETEASPIVIERYIAISGIFHSFIVVCRTSNKESELPEIATMHEYDKGDIYERPNLKPTEREASPTITQRHIPILRYYNTKTVIFRALNAEAELADMGPLHDKGGIVTGEAFINEESLSVSK